MHAEMQQRQSYRVKGENSPSFTEVSETTLCTITISLKIVLLLVSV